MRCQTRQLTGLPALPKAHLLNFDLIHKLRNKLNSQKSILVSVYIPFMKRFDATVAGASLAGPLCTYISTYTYIYM